MGYAIPLKRIGTYVLDQITRARDASSEAPDGGPPLLLRYAEISIAFATADGLPVDPPILVVGETPIPVDEARRRLDALNRAVRVALSDVSSSKPAARGCLIMNVVF